MEFPSYKCRVCKKTKPKGAMASANDVKSGIRHLCKECNNTGAKNWYKRNAKAILERKRIHRFENIVQYNLKAKLYHRKKREIVIAAYGGKCACCGESQFEFLAVDHIHGNGRAHIKSIGGANRFLHWLKSNDYPKGFRILCHNCNQALGFYGACPHDNLVDLLQ